jgi:hypothetical protein
LLSFDVSFLRSVEDTLLNKRFTLDNWFGADERRRIIKIIALLGGGRNFGMFGKTVTLFKVFGFSVRLAASWLVILALVVWSLARGVFPIQ